MSGRRRECEIERQPGCGRAQNSVHDRVLPTHLLPAFGDLAMAIVVAGLFAQGHAGGVLCRVSFSGAAQARALEHRRCLGGTAPIGGACLYSLRNVEAVDSKPRASFVNEEQQNLALVPYPAERESQSMAAM